MPIRNVTTKAYAITITSISTSTHNLVHAHWTEIYIQVAYFHISLGLFLPLNYTAQALTYNLVPFVQQSYIGET